MLTQLLLIALLIVSVFILIVQLTRNKKNDTSDSIINLVNTQISESSRFIKEATEKLTDIKNTKNILVDLQSQIHSFEKILVNQKQRGNFSEFLLEKLLSNFFNPKQYAMQYQFKDGKAVDSIIKLSKDKIIPIDAKFPLEKYVKMMDTHDKTEAKRLHKLFLQDVKGRIDETAKYIRPGEKTVEYAVMYVPSEGIFTDIWQDEEVVKHAFEKHVIITGPVTFYTYISFISINMYQDKISDDVDFVIQSIRGLDNRIVALVDSMDKLGKSIKSVSSNYDKAQENVSSIENKVSLITSNKLRMVK